MNEIEEPFNSDKMLAELVTDILLYQRVTAIVETGTWHGVTTRWFLEWFPEIPYYGVEISPEKWAITKKNNPKASVSLAPSPIWLKNNMAHLGIHPFFYLDAHGFNDTRSHEVLDNELDVLVSVPNPIILVHDFDDGRGLPHEPGNDMLTGPVPGFIARRPDLVVYRSQGRLSVVGVALISKPFQLWDRFSDAMRAEDEYFLGRLSVVSW